MNYLVTGGAGFIGRWVVKLLLGDSENAVTVLDNYSNSRPENLAEFAGRPALTVVRGDVADDPALESLWAERGPFDAVLHLAAQIRVQDSIDDPRATYASDVTGTMAILERCRRQYLTATGLDIDGPFHLLEVQGRLRYLRPRLVFMSTCMVYDRAPDGRGIAEDHTTRPASPYAACKIAAENLVLSYCHTYRMPAKVIRPFNTYGPFQKRNSEGGVVAIFLARDLAGQPLLVKGDGTQTRDLMYVEDCARFVVRAGQTAAGDGEVINAGLGSDVSIHDLAALVADPSKGGHGVPVRHVEHDHPQAEIPKLLCDNRKAARLLDWRPAVGLEEGLRRTRAWIARNPEAV
jgi:nucleoside-diphosphate-sugar epimerase